MQTALLYVATGNRGKLREFAAIYAPHRIGVEMYAGYREPVEGASSYAGNAALKARTLAAQLRDAGIAASVIADDSGIELDALDGGPGVLSARFGGEDATWADRRRLIVEAADRTGLRAARFVCSLHYVRDDGRDVTAEADVRGEVPAHERGEGGFSYDAVFYYPPLRRTFAELSEEEKNHVSHRARAVEELLRKLGPKNPAGGM
jgi:XTP/dITP diphosphohydrolase